MVDDFNKNIILELYKSTRKVFRIMDEVEKTIHLTTTEVV